MQENTYNLLTPSAEELIKIHSVKEEITPESGIEKIHISKTIGHLAFWYEKLRNAVDYQEEHLLRKNTIRRIIARKYNIPIPSMEKDGLSLIKELVRANYIKQTEFSQITIEKIEQVLNKYAILRKDMLFKKTNKNLSYYLRILLDLISCEIEELLVSHDQDEVLARMMTDTVFRRLQTTDSIKNKLIINDNIYIYIAVHKSLLKSDQATIRYRIFEKKLPQWKNTTNEQQIIDMYYHFIEANREIDKFLFDPLVDKFQKIIKRNTAPFFILNQVIKDNQQNTIEILSNSHKLTNLVEVTCDDFYGKAGAKLRRSVIQSIIYIFFTKMVLGVIFELPYDIITIGSIHYLPLTVNLIFPPLFLYLITMSAKIPDWKNTEKIVAEIKTIIYKEDLQKDEKVYHLSLAHKRSSTKNFFLSFLYLLTFVISFGTIIFFLIKLDYNLISGILFFFFLSIVSFFAFRIRQNARELFVTDEKETISSVLSDFFFMPFLRIGRWFSIKFAGINVFLMILDFVIEAPFKTVIEIAEEWAAFIKEKKEEIS